MSKNILITGVSKGVGLEITRLALGYGYTVYGISRSFNADLERLSKDYPNTFHHKKFDLIHSSDIQKEVFKTFFTNDIKMDAYINNAAIAYDDIITNANIDSLQSMYQVNVFSPIMLTKYAIRNMILNKKKGNIIHISSISAHTGYKGLSMYASTKGALEAFSLNTAREWGGLGIKSNVVVPGFMDTEMSSGLSTEQKNRIYNRTSLKKETNVDSVAEMVLFLISDMASSITGQAINVDSGTI